MRLASLALLSAVAATSGAQQPTSQPLNALEPLAPVDSSAPRPLQVGLTVDTRGLGLEVARLVAPRLALRVGASGAARRPAAPAPRLSIPSSSPCSSSPGSMIAHRIRPGGRGRHRVSPGLAPGLTLASLRWRDGESKAGGVR